MLVTPPLTDYHLPPIILIGGTAQVSEWVNGWGQQASPSRQHPGHLVWSSSLPALLLVWNQVINSWIGQLQPLARHRQVVVYEARGQGEDELRRDASPALATGWPHVTSSSCLMVAGSASRQDRVTPRRCHPAPARGRLTRCRRCTRPDHPSRPRGLLLWRAGVHGGCR